MLNPFILFNNSIKKINKSTTQLEPITKKHCYFIYICVVPTSESASGNATKNSIQPIRKSTLRA